MIRREAVLSDAVVQQIKSIVRSSRITQIDDSSWRVSDEKASRQELECKIDRHHIAFVTGDAASSAGDDEGKNKFRQLVHDLQALILTLIACHFKKSPI